MSGSVRVIWHGAEVRAETLARAREAEKAAGERLLDRANETVPRDTGALAETGFVESDESGVRVGYSSPYAVYQHEDRAYRHQGSGRAKWLELTAQEGARETGEEIAKETGMGYAP